MLKFRIAVLLLYFLNLKSARAEESNEIENLKSRVTALENEVSILKTEKAELLTVKTDVSFLMDKNSEIMEALAKIRQNDETVSSNAIGLIQRNDNPSYLQTISGRHFHHVIYISGP